MKVCECCKVVWMLTLIVITTIIDDTFNRTEEDYDNRES